VDDAEQLPLRVDLGLAPQRESAKTALLGVTEHRLDEAHAMGINRTALVAVDLLAHGAAVRVGLLALNGTFEEGHLSYRGDVAQVMVVPLNTVALRPLMIALALLSLSVFPAGHTQVPFFPLNVKSLGRKVFAWLGRLCVRTSA
jgi:hypothetical protein